MNYQGIAIYIEMIIVLTIQKNEQQTHNQLITNKCGVNHEFFRRIALADPKRLS